MLYSLEPLTDQQNSCIRAAIGIGAVCVERSSLAKNVGLRDATAVICRDRDNVSQLLDICEKLKFLFVVSAGVEKLPFEALRRRGVIVCNAGGVNAEIMAVYVMAYVLACNARVIENFQNQEKRFWKKFQTVESLQGKRMLIVGAGKVGHMVAQRAGVFGIECIGVRRHVVKNEDGFKDMISLDEARSRAGEFDFVISLLPVTTSTRGYFDLDFFSRMANNAVFINISRASVVKTADLISALENNLIAGAVVDVFDSEPLEADSDMWNCPHLLISPHSAGRLPDFMDQAIDCFCRNYTAYLDGDALPNKVDLYAEY